MVMAAHGDGTQRLAHGAVFDSGLWPRALDAQVAREGTKKTVFTNFMDLCKAMNRQQEHVSM